jgi:murein DD-endopeptidase MepM/ murein hydrolase activator NlpD
VITPVFPLPFLPSNSWRVGSKYATHFGAPRSGGFPVHGACDLFAPANTPVLAVDDGWIIRGPYEFMESVTTDPVTQQVTCRRMTFAIDVKHTNWIVRYGEISANLAKGLGVNSTVEKGQVIAFVAAQCGQAMLHFEMFSDVNRLDILTDSPRTYKNVPQRNYLRRNDLMDPTPYLDQWAADLAAKQAQQLLEKYFPNQL